jgi:hypothetical protein
MRGFTDGCINEGYMHMQNSVQNVLIAAPEAQWLLAPRFSVGKANFTNSFRSPVGTA